MSSRNPYIFRFIISVNLIVLTPLTENMPGSANEGNPSANKPGDMYVCVASPHDT